MRLDESIEPLPPRVVQQPERLSPCLDDPTNYDRNHGITIVLDTPVDMRIGNVRWLLGEGFHIRHNLRNGIDVRGWCQDETTNEATDRWYIHRYLSSEPNVIPISEVVCQDRHRRFAIGTNGVEHPSDVSLEALLSLVGEGAVAYAIKRYGGYFAYRLIDEQGELAAISPWTRCWQDWYDKRAQKM